ncbi:MAB_1171c family putative transporter [Streptomyces sp. NPDC053427]|uniref:MAB_1171c family putative transporter n=1 Tax=Streptomyces sp. NPDC053427 TaxID=3365701 RepID=UPI0037CD0AC8
MTVVELAGQIGWCSVVSLWIALLWRCRSALRLRYQRGLWLAVLTAAIAITLFQPDIVTWAKGFTGNDHAITLARNLVGVLSAGLTLLFIVGSIRERQLRLLLPLGLAAVLAALLFMDMANGPYPGPSIPHTGGPAAPSACYWLLIIAAHLLADLTSMTVCWQYSNRTDDRDLVWSLRVFALGSVFAIAYWSAYLLHLLVRIPFALPYMAVVINVHGLFRAASLLVPTATAGARRLADLRTVWALWPLWRDLLTAVPHVALARPQQSRLREVLFPCAPLALQAHRQAIETYDALLALQPYVPPDAYDQARRFARRAGVPPERLEAAGLAGALGQARRAMLADALSSTPGQLPGLDWSSPALLLAIARSWPLMSDALPGHDPAGTPQNQS